MIYPFYQQKWVEIFQSDWLKKNSKIIVIGDGTYLKAKEMGIKKVINIDGNLDDLKKQIILELKKGNKILHPKSNL